MPGFVLHITQASPAGAIDFSRAKRGAALVAGPVKAYGSVVIPLP